MRFSKPALAAAVVSMFACNQGNDLPQYPSLADFSSVPEWTAQDEIISSWINFRPVAPEDFVVTPATPEGELLAEVVKGNAEPELVVAAIRQLAKREAREEHERKAKAPVLASVGGGTAEEAGGPDIAPVLTGVPLLVSQGVDPVRAVITHNKGQVRYCHEIAGLKVGGRLMGRVEYLWNIDEGRAVDIRLVDNTTTDEYLARCIQAKISKWSFPEDREGVSYPFVFRG